MESENSHRNTSPKRTLLSRSRSSEYAAPSIQLAWEEKTHFVTVLLPLLLLLQLRSEPSCCPAQEMIHWYQAESQAELAEDHRDSLASGRRGGEVVVARRRRRREALGRGGRGLTLTCSRLPASCRSSMLDNNLLTPPQTRLWSFVRFDLTAWWWWWGGGKMFYFYVLATLTLWQIYQADCNALFFFNASEWKHQSSDKSLKYHKKSFYGCLRCKSFCGQTLTFL